MKIEVLYLEGCPHHNPAVERVKKVLNEMTCPMSSLNEKSVIGETATSMAFSAPQCGVNG